MPHLPVELLTKIWVEFLPPDPYLQPCCDAPPLLLLQVCRRWRELALRTPRLWRSLSTIKYDPVSPEDMVCYERWLSRAQGRPLWVEAHFHPSGMWRDEWVRFLSRYRVCVERLRVVDALGLDQEEFNALLDGAQLLRHLSLQAGHEEDERIVTIPHPHPALRILTLDRMGVSLVTLPNSGLSNLTHVAMRLPDGDNARPLGDLMLLMDSCPDLEVLAFSPVTANVPHPAPRSYPRLRSLCLVFDQVDSPVSPTLHLPGLLALRILRNLHHDLEEMVSVQEDEFHPPDRLCTIEVAGGGCGFSMFDLGWMNITHLDLYVDDASNSEATLAWARPAEDTVGFQGVLRRCPNLRDLWLHAYDGGIHPRWLQSPITHPLLKVLAITACVAPDNLLAMATLPALEKLTVHTPFDPEYVGVRGFLQRSRCPLRALNMRGRRGKIVWTDEDWEGLTKLIPTLVTARMEY